jgi:DNA-binding transcriptional regulator YiaG
METNEIKTLIESKIKTRGDMAKEIGISYSTLNGWLLGKSEPKQAALKVVQSWAEKQKL